MQKAEIAIVGLGIMGQNLARNFSNQGIRTVAYNRTKSTTKEFMEKWGNPFLSDVQTIKELVESLSSPKKILLMISSGEPVDQMINLLIPHLKKGDIIIDGGNSHYKDTIRRSKELKTRGLRLIGMGVSGGEEGALKGASLMLGGSTSAWKSLKKILQPIAAKDCNGQPCVDYMGNDGAGHYVKMIHNGIEYAIVELMAEAYNLLRKVYALTAPEIAGIFKSYANGRLKSYLFDISVPVLMKKDPLSKDYLINRVLDGAEQKGTGAWCVSDALEGHMMLSIISEAVFARIASGMKTERVNGEKAYGVKNRLQKLSKAQVGNNLESALHMSIFLSYIQGLTAIARQSKSHKWKTGLKEVVRIWQGGCIIRSDMLKELEQLLTRAKKADDLITTSLIKKLKEEEGSLREIAKAGIMGKVALPCFASALHYFDTFTSAESGASLIQAMRDSWGAHTYKRKDRKGIFHTDWEKS